MTQTLNPIRQKFVWKSHVRKPSLLLKLHIVAIQKFCYHGNAVDPGHTATSRKVVAKNVHATTRKVIWDMINTLPLLSNILLLLYFSTRKHTSMTSCAILSNFFFVKKSELKTTHNTFRDCRVDFFPTTFLQIAHGIYGKSRARPT